MPRIALFVEDFAHQKVVGSVIERIAAEFSSNVDMDWRSAVHGHGKVASEFSRFLRDLARELYMAPDLIVIASDGNCKGAAERIREFRQNMPPAQAGGIPPRGPASRSWRLRS